MRRTAVFNRGATVQRFRWRGFFLAVAALSTWSFVPASSTASAATSPSTLCSGFEACAQGAFTTHGYQNAIDESFWRMFAGNNCTNYVAFVESSTYEVPTPTYDLGNGGQWAYAAAQHGAVVNHVPSVGAVAVWDGDTPGMPAEGHVAIVEAVGPRDSYVVISQQHMIGPDGYDWVRIMRTTSAYQWEAWPDDFIHFPSPRIAALKVGRAHLRRG
jgi:surface antigen